MTPIELLSIAPGLRKRVHNSTAVRRVVTRQDDRRKNDVTNVLSNIYDEDLPLTVPVSCASVEDLSDEDLNLGNLFLEPNANADESSMSPSVQTFVHSIVNTSPHEKPPPDRSRRIQTTQIQDLAVPSDTYVIPDDATDPPSLIVADETLKLCLLFVWINNNRLVEGMLDGGSQIVMINE